MVRPSRNAMNAVHLVTPLIRLSSRCKVHTNAASGEVESWASLASLVLPIALQASETRTVRASESTEPA